MRELVAFVDCSSFYCSCERVFAPQLRGKPVVVLSNNDGCVISLTQEAKDAGIPMGAPYFKWRDVMREKGVAAFSSNYTLYADMSKRVIEVLARTGYAVEQYSIDEAFLHIPLDDAPEDLGALAREIHDAVVRGTGIAVRVSIAETKTLAKAGAVYAKGLIRRGEVPALSYVDHPDREQHLATLPASEIWGVGMRWAASLSSIGVNTAAELAAQPAASIQRRYGSVLARTVLELNGVPSIAYQGEDITRKTIIRSRMFAERLNDYEPIERSIAMHVARAAEKLRQGRLLARTVSVSISTGRKEESYRRGRAFRTLPAPTSDTSVLLQHAGELLKEAYLQSDPQGRPYRYAKSGIYFGGLCDESVSRQGLFPGPAQEGDAAFMQLVDALNAKHGRRSVGFAALGDLKRLLAAEKGTGVGAAWNMKRDLLSPAYTTDWQQLFRERT